LTQKLDYHLLKIVFEALFPILLFSSFFRTQIPHIPPHLQTKRLVTKKNTFSTPKRLIIPNIHVDAAVQDVGVTETGAMGVPTNAVDVGWFDLGPRPGEGGSAVIAGHFDDENGNAGVFANLSKLKRGDKLYIKESNGKTVSFVVSTSLLYDPGHADDVFNASSSAHLNLITCDGTWDSAQKSYTKRLVVFSVIVR